MQAAATIAKSSATAIDKWQALIYTFMSARWFPRLRRACRLSKWFLHYQIKISIKSGDTLPPTQSKSVNAKSLDTKRRPPIYTSIQKTFIIKKFLKLRTYHRKLLSAAAATSVDCAKASNYREEWTLTLFNKHWTQIQSTKVQIRSSSDGAVPQLSHILCMNPLANHKFYNTTFYRPGTHQILYKVSYFYQFMHTTNIATTYERTPLSLEHHLKQALCA